MSIRELPKEIADQLNKEPCTPDEQAKRLGLSKRLDELTSKVKKLQAKEERERVDHAVATVLLAIRERAEKIETHFRDASRTKQPHTAKGAIKDFVAIVDEELAKVQPLE